VDPIGRTFRYTKVAHWESDGGALPEAKWDQDNTESQWIDSDELHVVRAFLDAGVRFLIIGGRAVRFHGLARLAKDLDLLVEFSAANWPKLRMALRRLNDGVLPIEKLSQHNHKYRLRFYPTVEFLTAINGVSFGEAWSESIETTIEGLKVRIVSKAHLILSKQHSGRPTDADDINRLQNTS